MEVSSPIDVLRLRAGLDTVARVQFQVPLSEADYRTLAAILAEHPSVTLRAYGSDAELSTLRFLRWFPHLRRLSVAGLFHLTDLTPLHQLDADVEFLDLGETRKPLDLTPATAFRNLRELRIASHRRGLAGLLHTNPNLQGLALWGLPVDQILPVVTLPHLQSLSLTLGSLTDAEWLTQIPTLRYLALRNVRRLTNLEPVTRLTALQWLILNALTIDQLPDFSPSTALLRVDLDGMRRLRQPNALHRLAAAPRLQDLWVTQSSLPSRRSSRLPATPPWHMLASASAANAATVRPNTCSDGHHHATTTTSPRPTISCTSCKPTRPTTAATAAARSTAPAFALTVESTDHLCLGDTGAAPHLRSTYSHGRMEGAGADSGW